MHDVGSIDDLVAARVQREAHLQVTRSPTVCRILAISQAPPLRAGNKDRENRM
jgi:hypothetical protein